MFARFPLILGALALAPSLLALPAQPTTVLFDGDVRGVLGGPRGVVARGHALVADRRAAHPGALLLSTGSVLGPSPTSTVDGGAAMVELMNRLGYQAMALGRKDFFAGKENLVTRLAAARFPVIASNLTLRGGSAAVREGFAGFHRYLRLEQGGRSLVLFGVVSPDATSYGPKWDPEVEVGEPVPTLEALRAEAGEADSYLVLGTLSLREGAAVLRDLPWVDLVLANKIGVDEFLDDSAFEFRLRDGRGMLWTEVLGRSLGEVALAREGAALRIASRSHDVGAFPGEEPAARARVIAAREDAGAVLSETLTELSDAELADFPAAVADGLRHELACEVAVIHAGSIRTDVAPARSLTREGLRLAYPFTDHGARVAMKGRDLRALWKERSGAFDPDRHLLFAGVEERAGVVLVNGRALRDGDIYRVATVDFLTLGGFGPLLTGKGEVVPVQSVELLERWFRRDRRAGKVRHLRNRVVHRSRTKIDLSYGDLSFDGAARALQFQEPATINTSSDIPGLVGLRHRKLNLSLFRESVFDRVRRDLVLRFRGDFSTFAPNGNELNALDKGTFLVRLEEKKPTHPRRPRRYASLDLTTAFEAPDVPGKERPLFVKGTAGLLWRKAAGRKVYAGLGAITRFSQVGNPTALGVHLGYEFERAFRENLTLRSTLDGFVSVDSDQVRTADWVNELRLGPPGGFHGVLRHTTFLYRDSTVRASAFRDETFVGVGYDLTRRRRR